MTRLGPETGSLVTVRGSLAEPAKNRDEIARRQRALLNALTPTMLQLAFRSIVEGFRHNQPLVPHLAHYPPALQQDGASFVTLKQEGALRGCIGSVIAHQPLATDIADSAFKAAFRDPRFKPVVETEWPALSLSISLLSKPAPWPVANEEEAISGLRPGHDGVILQHKNARGLFLPAVWESIPEPRLFMRRLKQKAGLSPDGWEPDYKLYKFGATEIKEPVDFDTQVQQ